MGAEIKDLYAEQGVDFIFDITLTKFDGTSYDLNLYTLSALIKIGTSEYSPTFTEYSAGLVRMSLSALETKAMRTGIGSYVIDITEDATGEVDRLIKGRVYVDKGVS